MSWSDSALMSSLMSKFAGFASPLLARMTYACGVAANVGAEHDREGVSPPKDSTSAVDGRSLM